MGLATRDTAVSGKVRYRSAALPTVLGRDGSRYQNYQNTVVQADRPYHGMGYGRCAPYQGVLPGVHLYHVCSGARREVVAGVRGRGKCVTGCSENSQTAKCRRLCCQMLCLVVGMTEGRYVGGDGLV